MQPFVDPAKTSRILEFAREHGFYDRQPRDWLWSCGFL